MRLQRLTRRLQSFSKNSHLPRKFNFKYRVNKNVCSLKFIKFWSDKSFSKWHTRMVKAIRPLRIQIGKFFHITNSLKTKYFGAIIERTIDALLASIV